MFHNFFRTILWLFLKQWFHEYWMYGRIFVHWYVVNGLTNYTVILWKTLVLGRFDDIWSASPHHLKKVPKIFYINEKRPVNKCYQIVINLLERFFSSLHTGLWICRAYLQYLSSNNTTNDLHIQYTYSSESNNKGPFTVFFYTLFLRNYCYAIHF